MSLGDDRRAQSIQVGAILLFGVLIILLATYQAVVVPNQNRQVEGNHLETIAADMQELRNELVSLSADASVTLELGTTYPARVVALNPAAPTGTIRTDGTGDPAVNLTIADAVATTGEVDDVWDGTNRTYATGTVAYRPNYNEFRNAPTIVYENTLLYHAFRSGSLVRADQTLIDGDRLSLVTVNGSLDRAASGAVSVDLRAVSTSSRQITVRNETGENVTVSFTSRLNASQWSDRLEAEFIAQGGHVVDVTDSEIAGSDFTVVHVELERDVTYALGMTKVGVGTRIADEPVAYLAEVDGDSRAVGEGSTTALRVEARDRFNNPVSGVTVDASIESASGNGTLDTETLTTDEHGRASFQYRAANVDGPSPTFRVNASFVGAPGSGFDAATPANVTMNVTVQNTDGSGTGGGGGSGGAYTTSWLDPSGQAGVTCPNGADETCTVDASTAGAPTLTMGTTPTADGAQVEYSVNDTSVGTVDPETGETDAVGENETVLTPLAEGGLKVFTSSGGSGDALVLDVVNVVQQLVYNNDATAEDGADFDSTTGGVEFTMTNQFGQSLTVTEVKISSASGPAARLSDEVTPNDQPRRTELYLAADTNDGWVDFGGGEDLPITADMDSDGINNDGNPEASPGSTLTMYLYEFENSGGSRVDMTGRSVDVTITYELADGTTGSETFTVTPS